MISTDGLVHPYPDGDSSIRRMALEARGLGYDSVVSSRGDACEISGIRVIPGHVIIATGIRDVIGQIRREKDAGGLVLVNAGDNAFNRSVLSLKGVHVIRNLHATHKHSFDHVTGRLAAERGVAVEIDLRPLLHTRGHVRQKVMNRYQDLLRLQDRFGFPLTLASNAFSILDQRSVRDIINLSSLYGLERDQAREALGTVARLLSPVENVRVVG